MTMMDTAVSNPAHVTSHSPSADVYDPDNEGRSPVMSAVRPKLTPTPSPEPMETVFKVRAQKCKRTKLPRSSMGEGVLVHYMADGKFPDLSRQVADAPLPTERDDDRSMRGVGTSDSSDDDDSKSVSSEGEDGDGPDRDQEEDIKKESVDVKPAAQNGKATKDSLKALAAEAIRMTTRQILPKKENLKEEGVKKVLIKEVATGEAMEDVKSSLHLPSIMVEPSPTHPVLGGARSLHSKSPDALPPIQLSPVSSSGNLVTLPSLSTQLGNFKLPDTPRDMGFPQSPPSRPPLFHQGSPPRSPLDFRDRALPSPALLLAQQRRHSQADQHAYTSSVDYSSSTAETPSDKSTPGSTLGLSRMSIDGLDNPQIGGYHCVYPGCSAQPFQTQYLLNSHANVHSQNRPHYCPVKGCGRSEGGKGFKRKNEMIRHGLVHDSPGYVCPFCPDREHKYPRPDNLQRHVRVHHIDKDKDHPLLRDVLAQRQDGPNRGRRRRGTTG